jgi:dihydrofolate reductase
MIKISLIAAMSENRVIGVNNAMPWHIPEELQHFKKLTMGKPMIMGRKTFDAIGRRLLPGRKTIVLTRDQDLDVAGVTVAHSVAEALQAAGDVPEVMIVGGSGVYKEFLPLAHTIYLSIIPQNYVGDAFFPELDLNVWHLTSQDQHEKFCVQHFDKDHSEGV